MFKFLDGLYRWDLCDDFKIGYLFNRKHIFIDIKNLKKINIL